MFKILIFSIEVAKSQIAPEAVNRPSQSLNLLGFTFALIFVTNNHLDVLMGIWEKANIHYWRDRAYLRERGKGKRKA